MQEVYHKPWRHYLYCHFLYVLLKIFLSHAPALTFQLYSRLNRPNVLSGVQRTTCLHAVLWGKGAVVLRDWSRAALPAASRKSQRWAAQKAAAPFCCTGVWHPNATWQLQALEGEILNYKPYLYNIKHVHNLCVQNQVLPVDCNDIFTFSCSQSSVHVCMLPLCFRKEHFNELCLPM